MIDREEIGETQILASLLGVAEMVCTLTDTDELMATIVRVTPGLVRVDRCAIMAYDEPTREFHTLASFAPGSRRTPFDGLRIQDAEIPWLAHRLNALRLPALIKETTGEAGVSPALQQRLGMRSALVAPLLARGRFLGFLWLDDTQASHFFTSKEINVVQGISAQVAIALDGANLADQLDLERRRLRSFVSAVADGLITVNRDLRIVGVDAGAEALVGWQTSEVHGRRIHDVLDLPEAEASLLSTFDKGRPTATPKPLRLRARDGSSVECVVQGVAVRTGEGEVVQILYALRRTSSGKESADLVAQSTDR